MGYKSICVILGNTVSDMRMHFAARHLERAGYEVEVLSQVPHFKTVQHDGFIISRPGIQMIDFIGVALATGKPVIVDMDDNFKLIPPENPAYSIIGRGNLDYVTALYNMIKSVTMLTAPKPEILTAYERYGEVIPNGWDEENELWKVDNVERDGFINIGWAGTTTHRQDFQLVLPALKQILSEREDVRVVIGGDPAIYNEFWEFSERKKLFLVGTPYERYPLMFAFWDMLLAPLEDTEFNRYKSDIKLVEAGARGIPWIASPLPQYERWATGGILTPDSGWIGSLMALIDNGEFRQSLAEQGKAQALTRTSAEIGKLWVNIVKEVIG